MKELTVSAVVENIPEVTAFVDALLEAEGCSMKAQMHIDLAIDEIFANIASYAYEGNPGEATVRVDFDAGTREVEITFIDRGIPYDPSRKPDPDVTLSAEEREIGGLGIFLVKKTMDAMEYARVDGKNVLTLRKRIG